MTDGAKLQRTEGMENEKWKIENAKCEVSTFGICHSSFLIFHILIPRAKRLVFLSQTRLPTAHPPHHCIMPYFFILLYSVTRLIPSSFAVLVRLKLFFSKDWSMISRSVSEI